MTTAVPLLDLTRQYRALKSELDEAVLKVCSSQQFILGPEVERFERECATYCSVPYTLGMSSGTDAILVALMALEIGAGDEVITPAYSFFATAGCIARLGAKPVFVDISPTDYNIDVTLIERAITPKTMAIMPVHLFGQCADMTAIASIAKKHGLAVIEDAAQAIGSAAPSGAAGSVGDIGCFSFFPSKNLGAFGDGGLVSCRSENLYETLKMLRMHGSRVKYYHEKVGGNFRLDALQAAVLSVKLKYLDGWSEMRAENARRYLELFAAEGVLADSGPRAVAGKLAAPVVNPRGRHIFNQFVVRVQKREQVMEHLKREGIGCEVYYPLPLHLQSCFAELGYRAGDFPEAELAANESLAIPIFPELTEAEIARVAKVLSAAVRA